MFCNLIVAQNIIIIIYKEINKAETETTINVLYSEKLLSMYTNKIELEKQLYKILGEPKQEYIKGRSIIGSVWEVPLSEKTKISKIILMIMMYGGRIGGLSLMLVFGQRKPEAPVKRPTEQILIG